MARDRASRALPNPFRGVIIINLCCYIFCNFLSTVLQTKLSILAIYNILNILFKYISNLFNLSY